MEKYLKKYDGIRVEIGATGEILKVEIMVTGTWVTNEVVLEQLNLIVAKEAFNIGKTVTITIKN
jgi:Ca-activated chloride channel family protein